ncbi:MAG: site-specific integrase [Rhodoplanes sp.]
MPRPAKPPRLYLRDRRGRGPIWVVLDAGDEVSTGCGPGDREGAERALARYIARKHKPKIGISDQRVLPIADVLTYYLREKDPGEGRDIDNRTRKAFDDLSINVERLLEWWGDKALSEVKRSNCRAYVEHRTAQANRRFKNSITAPRVSPSTARRELEDLASAIAAYHAEYTLDAVPVVSLPPKPPRRQRWLTRTEAALLLWACLGWRYDARVGRLAKIPDGNGVRKQVRNRRKHLCRFILIGLYSGTRHMAIVRARWIASADEPHVDTERGLLFRRGSGERETSKRQPPARITPRLLAHMKRWKRLDATRGIAHIVHMNGNALTGKIRTAWEGARSDAALGLDVVPHVLRHTSATWLMQGGAELNDAAGFLGMSEQTLREHYWHHHPDFQDGVDEAFDRSRERGKNAPKNAQETYETRRTKRGDSD